MNQFFTSEIIEINLTIAVCGFFGLIAWLSQKMLKEQFALCVNKSVSPNTIIAFCNSA